MELSRRRRIINEQVFKEQNQQLERLVKPILNETGNQMMPLRFVCECSNLFCQESIQMNILEYESVRRLRNRFMVIPGHEQPDIDVVTQRHPKFFEVQKPALNQI